MKTNDLNKETLKMIQGICNELSFELDKKIKSAKFDWSTTGRIITKQPNNVYGVLFSGTTMNIKGTPNESYNLNDSVKIEVPQNNLKNAYILPKTGSTKDPNDVKFQHEHLNKEVLDKLTDSMLTAISQLKSMAYKDSVAKSDLTQSLQDEINAGGSKVQSDWNIVDTTASAYIKNKPTIPTSSENLSDGDKIMKTDTVWVLCGGNPDSY